MELVKKNINMEEEKSSSKEEFSIEKDIYLEDQYPEAIGIVCKKGNVKLDEPRGEDHKVTVSGCFQYALLLKGEEKTQLFAVKGEIPFTQTITMNSYEKGDDLEAYCNVINMTPEMINTRKISIRALLQVETKCLSLTSCDFGVDLSGKGEGTEICSKSISCLEIASRKKDVLRIKQEIPLPNQYSTMRKLLWKETAIKTVEPVARDGRVTLQGELQIFCIYLSEKEEIVPYETVIPITGTIESSGCQEGMLVQLNRSYLEENIEIKENFDGEERILQAEISMHFIYKIFEEHETEVLEDVYGTKMEILCEKEKRSYLRCVYSGNQKIKASDVVSVDKRLEPMLGTALFTEGRAYVEELVQNEEGTLLEGYLDVSYVCQEQKEPESYRSLEGQIPFSYQLPVKEQKGQCEFHFQVEVEQISANVKSDSEVEIKALLNISVMVFQMTTESVVCRLEEKPLDAKKMAELPGISIYYVKEGDSLWHIGKQYYLPIQTIKEQNHLVSNQIHKGDRLLISRVC